MNNLWNDNLSVNHVNSNNWNPNMRMNLYPQYEIIQVSGENGVDAFPMGPNSSILLADQTAPIIWLVRTDGAGYKSVKIPYDVTPHKNAPQIDVNSLEQRVKHLEELLSNGKQQSNNRQSKKQQQQQQSNNEPSLDTAN